MQIPVSHPTLHRLYKEMKGASITRQLFPIKVKGPNGHEVEFSVVFVAEEDPWKLVLGSKKTTPVRYEEVRIFKSYRMEAKDLKPDFIPWLREQLRMQFDPDNPFTREKFLVNELVEQTPIALRHRTSIKPSDMPLPSTGLEEGEKRVFLRWLPHHGDNGNVTEDNLTKTRQLISYEASQTCRRYNISSCWCNDPSKEQPIDRPEHSCRQ